MEIIHTIIRTEKDAKVAAKRLCRISWNFLAKKIALLNSVSAYYQTKTKASVFNLLADVLEVQFRISYIRSLT